MAAATCSPRSIPVTNAQFEHFVNDDGYINPKWWGGEDSPGWRWRISEHNTD